MPPRREAARAAPPRRDARRRRRRRARLRRRRRLRRLDARLERRDARVPRGFRHSLRLRAAHLERLAALARDALRLRDACLRLRQRLRARGPELFPVPLRSRHCGGDFALHRLVRVARRGRRVGAYLPRLRLRGRDARGRPRFSVFAREALSLPRRRRRGRRGAHLRLGARVSAAAAASPRRALRRGDARLRGGANLLSGAIRLDDRRIRAALRRLQRRARGGRGRGRGRGERPRLCGVPSRGFRFESDRRLRRPRARRRHLRRARLLFRDASARVGDVGPSFGVARFRFGVARPRSRLDDGVGGGALGGGARVGDARLGVAQRGGVSLAAAPAASARSRAPL